MLDPSTNTHFSNRISDSYNNFTHGYGVRAQKTEQSYWNNIGDFGAEKKLIDDQDSGFCSPPLWKSSPPRSPQNRQNHYRNLSPSSRAQAIARGQKELMEMVSKMPEGCYELSLKDIVEQNMVDQAKEEIFSKERSINSEDQVIRTENKKKNDKKLQMNRSASVDNNGGGFLLKMVFPVSWCSSKKQKKKKNSGIVMNNSGRDGRVSPKPLLFDGFGKGTVDNEWWQNRFSETGECESGGFSSNSGSSKSSGSSSSRSSSLNSSGRQGRGGCFCFIFRKRGNKTE